jgi:cyclohexa-1,5-dienecarbonyl-CoA hydratase
MSLTGRSNSPDKRTRLTIAIEAPIATIVLAHPPVNVIDIPMMEELTTVLADVEKRDDVCAILFRGEGKAFSAGVDISAHTPELIEEMLTKFHGVIRMIAKSEKITLAQVQGNCRGGGAELALMCDIVYTDIDATWGFPEIKLACYPPVACAALASVIGQKRAAELVFTGENFTGRDAMLIGLATACGPAEEMQEYTQTTLDRLSQLSGAALKMAKRAFYGWDAMHLDKGLARAEKIYLEELMKTEDVREGVRAWSEKRPPKWKNR